MGYATLAGGTMKPGQEVIVTAYGGEKVKLVVAEIIDNIVLVCTRKEFEEAAREARVAISVGYRAESVVVV
jgi:hypothetical protein